MDPICGHEYFLRRSVAARTYPIVPSSPFSFLRGCLYRRTSLVNCGAVAPIVLRCGIDLLYYNHLPHCAPNSPGVELLSLEDFHLLPAWETIVQGIKGGIYIA